MIDGDITNAKLKMTDQENIRCCIMQLYFYHFLHKMNVEDLIVDPFRPSTIYIKTGVVNGTRDKTVQQFIDDGWK